jgi:hypothetical protein
MWVTSSGRFASIWVLQVGMRASIIKCRCLAVDCPLGGVSVAMGADVADMTLIPTSPEGP